MRVLFFSMQPLAIVTFELILRHVTLGTHRSFDVLFRRLENDAANLVEEALDREGTQSLLLAVTYAFILFTHSLPPSIPRIKPLHQSGHSRPYLRPVRIHITLAIVIVSNYLHGSSIRTLALLIHNGIGFEAHHLMLGDFYQVLLSGLPQSLMNDLNFIFFKAFHRV